jgi:hypothetical protein
LLGGRLHEIHGFVNQVGDENWLWRKRQFASFYARNVEHLVDQCQEMAATFDHLTHRVALVFGEILEFEK